jgi:hypothetical protein
MLSPRLFVESAARSGRFSIFAIGNGAHRFHEERGHGRAASLIFAIGNGSL